MWRWLAAFLAGVVLAGIPAAFVSFTAPGRSDYEVLRKDVVAAQVQIARLEERLVLQVQANQDGIEELQRRISELRIAIDNR